MDQELLNSISGYTSKLLRKNFGKGPQSCQSSISGNLLVIYIRGFISPMEEVLINQGQRIEVERARTFVINHLLEELKGMIEVSLDREIEGFYHDWNFPNNSGAVIFILNEMERDISYVDPTVDIPQLEKEIARISYLVQKVPDQVKVFPISSTIYLVERIGILVRIEQSLIQKGFEEELRIAKDELEKSYLHRYGKFHEIFNKQVRDIFVAWNLKDDKSMIAFILH
ncbi:DUF2294 domain-containing protein [Bacillus pinisoli]|uniref:DUF2294 domain-containing protein n=1 Tax=Bacillus pinisoli TaxID=2901866 RepID=UPI001FF43817|nr:DUF2294 domain-containing protein [Bacillus pinisoli]